MKKMIFIESVAILIGTTIGAGILAIPYVMAKSGFLTGLLVLVIVAVMMVVINLIIGEITLASSKLHQLPGYAEKYLGKWGKWSMFYTMLFVLYGALLAYIIGEGQVITALFGGNVTINSLLFFVVGSFLVYLGLNIVKRFEVYLSLAILLIIFVIYYFSSIHIQTANLLEFSWSKILIPYGVILTASMGYSSIPQMREILNDQEKLLKEAIIFGTLIPIIVYLFFALIVVGVTGSSTTELATIGLGNIVGTKMIIFGNLFAFIAMATSFLTLGLAVKKTYIQDFRMSNGLAWLLTCSLPLALFLLGIHSFVGVISFIGALAGGLQGVVIILVFMRMKQRDRVTEFHLPHSWWLAVPMIIIFVLGMATVLIK
ncbi:MAG: aromatic amino acid transport family protein [Candidatus Komeilibacteria bacterium]